MTGVLQLDRSSNHDHDLEVSGHLFDFGPVGWFVVTDCHNTGDTPWEAGDTGGRFSKLVGNADTP